ncbi:MAG: nitrous oxide reductase accessory protein NosL [Acidimicrobiia bacterium]|nr:nitrous oxide reductase accessory protein NosL [Actinomycetota bacterium]MBL6924193.1 nitrous oxide reductase accessory protein NosL [Acidimicrobiia bacterium]
MTVSYRRLGASWLIGLSVLVMLSAGCGEATTDGVPEIIEGRSVCDECGMIIDDVRMAAAWRLPDGTSRVFDDIGDMLVNGYKHGDLEATGRWVFDYDTGDAVPVGSASFVASGDLMTPMGWGVVAYATEQDALDLAASLNGHVLSWDGLVNAHTEGNLRVHDHDMEHDH